MNNKEFINELASRSNRTNAETTTLVNELIAVMTDRLAENDTIAITGFGQFEVKKKMERISVNPATGLRYLVPPKLTLSFRQSNTMKDKINDNK